jgi:nucleoside phosphorylase
VLTIVTALPWEASRFVSRLTEPRRATLGEGWAVEGSRDGTPVRVVISGPGTERVRTAAAALETLSPATSSMLSVGVAGGLTEAVDRGALVLGTQVRRTEDDRRLSAPAAASDEGMRERVGAAMQAGGVSFRRGDILTVDRPLIDRSAKSVAFARSRALVGQMEDSAWAEWAQASGVPFVALRAVLDGVNDSLPAEVLTWNWLKPGRWRIARSVVRRPALGPALWQLRRRRNVAQRSIDRALEAVVASWDGSSG